MEREHFLEGSDWLVSPRRRRFRIGDLLVAVALTAIGLSAISRPDLSSGERLFLGAVMLVFMGLQWAQWGLASISITGVRPEKVVSLGVIASLLALSMFVLLIVLSLVFPRGAALISVMILVQVVYLTTWD